VTSRKILKNSSSTMSDKLSLGGGGGGQPGFLKRMLTKLGANKERGGK
jgi:hypothetical protein